MKQRLMVTGKYCITWSDLLCTELKGRSISLSLLLFLYNYTLLLTYQHFLAIGIVATFLPSRPDISLHLKIYVVLSHFFTRRIYTRRYLAGRVPRENGRVRSRYGRVLIGTHRCLSPTSCFTSFLSKCFSLLFYFSK
jgi:hypothetical protein